MSFIKTRRLSDLSKIVLVECIDHGERDLGYYTSEFILDGASVLSQYRKGLVSPEHLPEARLAFDKETLRSLGLDISDFEVVAVPPVDRKPSLESRVAELERVVAILSGAD